MIMPVINMDTMSMAMRRIRRIHFIGIGGVGMSGIAEVLLNLGYEVSGSDQVEGIATNRLKKLGAVVDIGHHPDYVKGRDVVVITSAVDENNLELLKARELHIPVIPRAEMLAELMRFRQGIAIAGTHGKTTTTSLVASVMAHGGLDPTYVIGGKLNHAESNAKLGASDYLVAEADESDASFLYLQPTIAVVTNIDEDHLDTYGGDFDVLKNTFVEFLHHLPFYGLAIVCIDDPVVKEILPQVTKPVLTYGLSEDADIRAERIECHEGSCRFTVSSKEHKNIDITLKLPGVHNIQNALAAIAVAWETGVDTQLIAEALSSFEGIARRFQIYPDLRFKNQSVLMVDDYAHHPNEIAAAFQAVRSSWPDKRLVVAFQPHRYSRTRDLFDDFSRVLSEPDVLILSDVYPAGEVHIAGADGKSLSLSIRQRGIIVPIYIDHMSELPETLLGILQEGDVLLTLGAGDVGRVASELSSALSALVEKGGVE